MARREESDETQSAFGGTSNGEGTLFLSAVRQIVFFRFRPETGKLRHPINPVNPV
jgi:hypothetical protein